MNGKSSQLASQGEAYIHCLLAILFESDYADAIVRRWITYAPIPTGTLKENLKALLTGICTSPVSVEITTRHLRIFDCDCLHIINDTIEEIPNAARILTELYPHFRRMSADNAQRDVTLAGFAFDQMLQHRISRHPILCRLLEVIFNDAAQTDSFVTIREMVELILTDLYSESKEPFIAIVIDQIRKSYRNFGAPSRCVFSFPDTHQSCIFNDPRYCIFHGHGHDR